MLSYPRISRDRYWALRYVRFISSLIPMAYSADEESPGSIDLSKATVLKNVVLKWKSSPRWVAMTLRTITQNHGNLQRISLEIHWGFYARRADNPANLRDKIGETLYQGWLELDAVLARLWQSRLIRSELVYVVHSLEDGKKAGRLVESLLPEATTRGIIDLIERRDRW